MQPTSCAISGQSKCLRVSEPSWLGGQHYTTKRRRFQTANGNRLLSIVLLSQSIDISAKVPDCVNLFSAGGQLSARPKPARRAKRGAGRRTSYASNNSALRGRTLQQPYGVNSHDRFVSELLDFKRCFCSLSNITTFRKTIYRFDILRAFRFRHTS